MTGPILIDEVLHLAEVVTASA